MQQDMRFPWLHGEGVSEAWQAQMYANAIHRTEGRLAYARREGRTYSSYARWAERLESDLVVLRQLAQKPSP